MDHGHEKTVHHVLKPFSLDTYTHSQDGGYSESVCRHLDHGDTAERNPHSEMQSHSEEVNTGNPERVSKNLREGCRMEAVLVEAEAYLMEEVAVEHRILVGRTTFYEDLQRKERLGTSTWLSFELRYGNLRPTGAWVRFASCRGCARVASVYMKAS